MLDALKLSIAQKLYPVHVARSREEYEAIWALRYKVYVEEYNRNDHPDADHDQHWIRFDSDETENTYLLYTGTKDAIQGTFKLRIFPQGEIPGHLRVKYSLDLFEDLGTRKTVEGSSFIFDRSLRGTTAATALACRAITLSCENGAEVLIINCVPGLLRMYQKLGLRPYGAQMVNQFNLGMVVPLIGMIDIDYFRRIGSPMYYVLKKLQRRGVPLNSSIAPLLKVIKDANETVKSDVNAIREELHIFFNELSQTGRRGELQPTPALLTTLSKRVVQKLSGSSHIVDIAPDIQMIEHDIRDQELYFVLSGTLEIRFKGKADNREVVLTRGKGDIIGEVGFFRESGKRSASVFTVTPCRILILRRSFLKRLVKEHPRDACVFYEAISRITAEHVAEHVAKT